MNMTYTCTPCASIPMLARSLAANHIQGYYVPEGIKRKKKKEDVRKKNQFETMTATQEETKTSPRVLPV